MPYPTDFLDSHRQHWTDAEILYLKSRWLNADQLYGMCAECGLKAVMLISGMSMWPSGVPKQKRHKKHVDGLWMEFATFVAGRIGGRYQHMLPNANPFTNWSIHNRYAGQRNFTLAGVTGHRCGALRVRAMVQQAEQDGVL